MMPRWIFGRVAICCFAALVLFVNGAIVASADLLSPQERAWLDAHGPLRYAPDPAFPPFEFFREDGTLAGATPELLDILARNLGTQIQVVRYSSWTDVLQGMKRGEADLLGTITRTPEREQFLLFTRPYLEVPFVLFLNRDIPSDVRLEAIVSNRLGVVDSVGAHSWLRQHHPGIAPILLQSAREGLMLLSIGQLDGLVETLPVGAQIISDLGLNSIHVSPNVLSTEPQHLAVALTNQVLLSILQKGLDSIPAPDEARVLRHWMGFEIMQTPSLLPKWARRLLWAVGALVVLLVAWIVSLRRMVALRTYALSASENRYRTLLENLPQMIFLKDAQSVFVSCNERFANDLDIESEQIAGKTDFDFFPPHLAELYRADDQEVMRTRSVREVDEEYMHKGQYRTIHTVKTPVFDEGGEVRGVLGIFWDVSEQRQHEAARARLELQLRQSQKMEAVGRLAGGVAHDFNNILTVILGNTNLLSDDPTLTPETRETAQQIAEAAGRAADLTRQLLMFSRRQMVEMRVLNLNEIIKRMQPILEPLTRDRVTLKLQLQDELPSVSADANMMEQVVLNLALNARDAMPGGGCVTICTRGENIPSAPTLSESDRPPGSYVVLEVEDTGHGMDEETKAHLFEPFFTTKSVGQGTGLGLASVYGIIQQHLGWIDVDSEPGKGSRFSVYLPTAAVAADNPPVPRQDGPLPRGNEFVLVVEDETPLRRMTSSALVRLGYRVREASTGDEAMLLWPEIGGDVQLLLSDVVMPGQLSGLTLARELRKLKPNLTLILCSGYSEDVLFQTEDMPLGVRFLPKPYDIRTLATVVRQVLDQSSRGAAG